MTSSPPPKVLHVTTTDVSLDLLLRPQLEAFAASGYEVVTASAPGPHVAALRDAGLRHVPLPSSTRSMDLRRDGRATAELVSAIRAERPDIVHTHNPKPGWFGRPAARACRAPVVVNTVHGLYATPDDAPVRRAVVYALERLAAACSDAELVQNPEDVVRLRALGVPRSKLVVLGNGIDLERFAPQAVGPDAIAAVRAEAGAGPGDVLVGAVGRLVWEKGLREVLDAAAALRDAHPEVRVAVVGPLDPEKGDGLRAEDLPGLTARTGVAFLPAREDIETVYAALDLYVLASHREGFPRSAMEAAAMGVPVVATDIRGCRQVVDDGRTGRLVPVRDARALAEAVADLAGDGARRATMGRAGRAKAEAEFDQRSCIRTTLATYDRLLVAAGRSAGATGGAR